MSKARHHRAESRLNKPPRGPEYRFYDKLKKKHVRLQLRGEDAFECVLLWVDTYSIGVRLDFPAGQERLIMKGSLDWIEPDERFGDSHGARDNGQSASAA